MKPLALPIVLLLTSAICPAGPGDSFFDIPRSYVVSEDFEHSRHLTSGDFDNDGDIDLVVTIDRLDVIRLLFNNGDGTYTPGGSHPVNRDPRYCAAGDFDNDGLLDLAIGHYNGEGVVILLGNGHGTFISGLTYYDNYTCYSLTLGDWNEDGIVDIAAALNPWGGYDHQVGVLLGLGDGTFSLSGPFPCGSHTLYSICHGDFDEDGHLDLAVAASNGYIHVLEGLGDGLFGTGPLLVTGCSYWSLHNIVCDDFNEDGHLDLAAACGTVLIYLGDGAGSFTAGEQIEVGTYPYDMDVGDVDGDGHLDLALGYNVEDVAAYFTVLRGDGAGSFEETPFFQQRLFLEGMLLEDLNGDGALDAAMVSAYGYATVLLNRGDGALQWPYTGPVGSDPNDVKIGDLNEDGILDVVTANGASQDVTVLLGAGGGYLHPGIDYAARHGAVSMALGDLNGDGHLDVVTANDESHDVAVLYGNGDGTLQEPRYRIVGGGPQSVVLEDLEGDGDLDVAVVNYYSNNMVIILSRGNGSFEAPVRYPLDSLGHPVSLALADLNGDGFPDAAACHWVRISILLGSSTGVFSYGQVYSPGVGMLDDASAGDVNEDGMADLVVVSGEGLFIMLGNGDGTFDGPGPFLDGRDYARVDCDDIDGDGHLDLICPCPDRRGVSVLHGDGTGGFGEARHYVTGGFPYSAASGDLDGDGRPDLASASWSGNHVSVLLNDPYDPATLGGALACQPESGAAPLGVGFSATLTNTYSGSPRLVAGRIDVKLAGGQGFGNWRSGYISLDPGQSRIIRWNFTLPAAQSFIGDNRFRLTVEDVTPPPYNQPPYPAAGHTDRDGCTVTAFVPDRPSALLLFH